MEKLKGEIMHGMKEIILEAESLSVEERVLDKVRNERTKFESELLGYFNEMPIIT